MYHKIKSTVAGLGMAAAFFAASLMLQSPLKPATAAQPSQAQPERRMDAQELAIRGLTLIALSVIENELGAQPTEQADPAVPVTSEAPAASLSGAASRLRAQLGMPYYSFGAAFPRRGES
jgi:hypothetical protein